MKTIFTSIILLLLAPIFTFGQLNFEALDIPKDCNIYNIHKSPNGEYFLQLFLDFNHVYSSGDGENWTRLSLRYDSYLDNMEFYSDGTPVMNTKGSDNYIRRNGQWHRLEVGQPQNLIRASHIHNDTLFALFGYKIIYSIDKGETFEDLFQLPSTFNFYDALIWKTDEAIAILEDYGGTKTIYIYDNGGRLLYSKPLEFGGESQIFSDCGKLLSSELTNYALFDINTRTTTIGKFPDANGPNSFDRIVSVNDKFYGTAGNNLYASDDCEMNWQLIGSDVKFEESDYLRINSNGEILVGKNEFETESNLFYEASLPNLSWQTKILDLYLPHDLQLNESLQGERILVTPNKLYTSNQSQPDWEGSNTPTDYYTKSFFTADGTLFVHKGFELLISEDNGLSYDIIELPRVSWATPNSLHVNVFEDGIILTISPSSREYYYSLDYGSTWESFSLQSNFSSNFYSKKLGNYIYIIEFPYNEILNRVDIRTGEVSSINLDPDNNFYILGEPVILEDGNGFFTGEELGLNGQEGLFSFNINEPASLISTVPFTDNEYRLKGAGQDLYLFHDEEYAFFNGSSWNLFPYIGLPPNHFYKFYVADNQFVFAVSRNSKIYRSTHPLSNKNLVQARIIFDSNDNCSFEQGEIGMKNWKFTIENNNYLKILNTNDDGSIALTVPDGEYTIGCEPINESWDLCETSFDFQIQDGAAITKDFLAKAVEDCANLTVDFSTPLLRRCFNNNYFVYVTNSGPSTAYNSKLTIVLDPNMNFVSTDHIFTQIDAKTFEFDLGNLNLGEEVFIKLNVEIDCDSELGDIHCVEGILTTDNSCANTGSGSVSYEECQENIGSFDPNDKRIFNTEGKETNWIEKDEYAVYHIRFQNTGTDTAFTVKVVDRLSDMLDINSFEMLSASHNFEYSISKGPVLEVVFNDILLVDSFTNEPGSHGYFKFKIKPKPEFDYGTTIPNSAAIYFDFNDAVLTNEALLSILRASSTKNIENKIDFRVFPNPVKAYLNVDLLVPEKFKISTFEIVNQKGIKVMEGRFYEGERIWLNKLVPGLYNLVLKNDNQILGSQIFIKR